MNAPTNTPSTLTVLLSVIKSCSVRGENCEEYVVKTTIIVEKEIVVIVRMAVAMELRMVVPRSTLVNSTLGRAFCTESIKITIMVKMMLATLYILGTNQMLSLAFNVHLSIVKVSPFIRAFSYTIPFCAGD
jgi:hypothetical protein